MALKKKVPQPTVRPTASTSSRPAPNQSRAIGIARPTPPDPQTLKQALSRPVPKRPTAAINTNEILEKINRRQRQIIVHSVIYYGLNTNVITDATWNTWALELVELQHKYPDIAKTSAFWEDMKDFDGSTGHHLAEHTWGTKIAMSIIRSHESVREVKRV